MKQLLIVMMLIGTAAWAKVPAGVFTDTQARVVAPRVPRIKLLRSNPHRFTAIRFQGTNPSDTPDDDYICSGSARRPKAANPPQSDDQLSDYVMVRLAVARARAMQKYRELHA